jgi:hypothetical protein
MEGDYSALPPVPSDLDILFGRDDYIVKHVGNVSLRTAIGLSFSEYNSLPSNRRLLKNRLLKALVEGIRKSGGRFLQRTGLANDSWKEVEAAEARMKVGQVFRDIKKDWRVLEHSSLLLSPRVTTHFKSAHDFNWADMVEASKQELKKCHQQRSVVTPSPIGDCEAARPLHQDRELEQQLKDLEYLACKNDGSSSFGGSPVMSRVSSYSDMSLSDLPAFCAANEATRLLDGTHASHILA